MEPRNTKALYRQGFATMMQCQEGSRIKEALGDFQLALSFGPPKDQEKVLLKKMNECQNILSCQNDANDKTTEKKKLRSHDTQALAF